MQTCERLVHARQGKLATTAAAATAHAMHSERVVLPLPVTVALALPRTTNALTAPRAAVRLVQDWHLLAHHARQNSRQTCGSATPACSHEVLNGARIFRAPCAGLDTCLSIMKVLHQGHGDPKYRPCPLLAQYVDAGWHGQKSGKGVYHYEHHSASSTH
jgi:hypothetical protein